MVVIRQRIAAITLTDPSLSNQCTLGCRNWWPDKRVALVLPTIQ